MIWDFSNIIGSLYLFTVDMWYKQLTVFVGGVFRGFFVFVSTITLEVREYIQHTSLNIQWLNGKLSLQLFKLYICKLWYCDIPFTNTANLWNIWSNTLRSVTRCFYIIYKYYCFFFWASLISLLYLKIHVQAQHSLKYNFSFVTVTELKLHPSEPPKITFKDLYHK